MTKIVKIKASDWHPIFGYSRAQYGVEGFPKLRIVNDASGWRCYGVGQNLEADSRKNLEKLIKKIQIPC